MLILAFLFLACSRLAFCSFFNFIVQQSRLYGKSLKKCNLLFYKSNSLVLCITSKYAHCSSSANSSEASVCCYNISNSSHNEVLSLRATAILGSLFHCGAISEFVSIRITSYIPCVKSSGNDQEYYEVGWTAARLDNNSIGGAGRMIDGSYVRPQECGRWLSGYISLGLCVGQLVLRRVAEGDGEFCWSLGHQTSKSLSPSIFLSF